MEADCHTSCPADAPALPPGAGHFSIEGMSCGNCVRHVTQAIQEVPGVASVKVSLETREASVRWSDQAAQNPQWVIEAVSKAGFKAAPLVEAQSAQAGKASQGDGWLTNLLIGAACTAPMMIGEWVFGWGSHRAFQWFSMVLAAVAQTLAGARFYKGAWLQLKARSANMDTLVALGSTTAFAFSLGMLFRGGMVHAYFMEASAILTFISFGHYLEARMSRRAAGSLNKLLHLAPSQCRRLNADGSETTVLVAELKPNDMVALRPGERIPADGKVLEGESSVDESMLTGEAVPVDKTLKSLVYAGTVNLNRRLVVQVLAAGEATALAAIIAAVERAQNSRANIQRLGDRVSGVFVPVVLLMAVVTAALWSLDPAGMAKAAQAIAAWAHLSPHITLGTAAPFICAAAVLIIACPCAMGLATPIAIMAGTNAAAERGILIRDGIALEKAGAITTVIFDKTGTLTSGQATVAQFATYVGGDRPKLHEMKLAASMARHSDHPLSRTIAQLHSEDLTFFSWEELSGRGLQCLLYLPDRPSRLATARLGSVQWLRESGVDLTSAQEFLEQWSAQGATLLGISVDHWLMGMVAMQDTIKPQAGEVVRDLRARGLRVCLLTGDNQRTAHAIGKRVGIPAEDVHAEVRPEQKAEIVQKLQARGERVAFVGDGINDAPALEQADLGIAVSRASDIALEAADLVLLRSDIQAVPESLGLARAALRTIKQNLFWAFFYNAIGIPLAALGLLNPMLCAAAMGASDLAVIGNALALRYWRLFDWRLWKNRLSRVFSDDSTDNGNRR